MSGSGLRDDALISVCFPDAEDPTLLRNAIMPVAESLQARYRYWEILIVNETGAEASFGNVLLSLPNARYLSVVVGLDAAQRRVIAASEAIGDVVVLTSVDEASVMDITAMIECALNENAVVVGQRRALVFAEPVIRALGRASGFRASTRDMKTAAFPRTVLNRLLTDANPVLALRFRPRDNTIKVIHHSPISDANLGFSGSSGSVRLASRLDLILRMITDAGPMLLASVALLSAMMFLGGILFFFYIIVVYLFVADIAPGWTTISLAISGMLCFLGAAMFGICVTLRKVAEMVQGGQVDYLVSERSSVDLFESVSNALNVETEAQDAATSDITPLPRNAP